MDLTGIKALLKLTSASSRGRGEINRMIKHYTLVTHRSRAVPSRMAVSMHCIRLSNRTASPSLQPNTNSVTWGISNIWRGDKKERTRVRPIELFCVSADTDYLPNRYADISAFTDNLPIYNNICRYNRYLQIQQISADIRGYLQLWPTCICIPTCHTAASC